MGYRLNTDGVFSIPFYSEQRNNPHYGVKRSNYGRWEHRQDVRDKDKVKRRKKNKSARKARKQSRRR